MDSLLENPPHFAGWGMALHLFQLVRITRGLVGGIQMRIMIVDNDPTYLGLLNEVLVLHGYDVVTAKDGQEALEKLRESVVDLVISDISMPRMNGIILHRHLRASSRLRHIPFAWNSVYRELRDVAAIEDPSLDVKFEKSMPVPVLLRTIEGITSRCLQSQSDRANQ